MEQVYEHSGRLGLGPAVVPVAGVLAPLALSLIYAYVTVYSPIAGYVTILFVGAYAAGLAFALVVAGRAGKVRNSAFMGLAGLAVGLLAVYFSWAAFEAVLIGRYGDEAADAPGYLDLLFAPGEVWAICQDLNEDGWYSIRGTTPKGIALWIMWGIEAVIVVGAAVFGAMGSIADEVFCESCNEWCGEKELGLVLGLPTDEGLFNRVREGDLGALESLGLPATDQFLTIELRQCEACSNTASYQAKLIEPKVDDQGNPTADVSDFSQVFITDSGGVDRLEALAARLTQEAQNPPEPEPDGL